MTIRSCSSIGRATTAVAILLCAVAYLNAQLLPGTSPRVLRIRTTPGAAISVDGKAAGYADATGIAVIKNPKPGVHKIRISMEGKQPFEQTVTVFGADQVANISAVLADIAGDLEVLTTPGAEISVDDQKAGEADAEGRLLIKNLAVGVEHSIRVVREGHAPQYATARVTEGSVATLSLPLGEAGGRMPAAGGPTLGRLVFRRAFSNPRTLWGDHPAFEGVSFSPDSSKVGAYDNSRWIVWDVESGRQAPPSPIDTGSETYHAFAGISRDWRYLAVLLGHSSEENCDWYVGPEEKSTSWLKPCRFELVLWDMAGAKVAARFPEALNLRESDYFDFSGDSRYIVLASPGNRVSVYEIASGRRLWTVQEGYLRQVLFSRRGDSVVVVRQLGGGWKRGAVLSCGRGSICIREAGTGKQVQVLERPEWEQTRVDAYFRPDGEWLAVAQQEETQQKRPAMVRLFELPALKEAPPVVLAPGDGVVFSWCGAYRFIPAFSFHPSGRYVAASVWEKSVKIWDLVESREVWSAAMPKVGSLAISPNGRWLAVEGGELRNRSIRLWEIVP